MSKTVNSIKYFGLRSTTVLGNKGPYYMFWLFKTLKDEGEHIIYEGLDDFKRTYFTDYLECRQLVNLAWELEGEKFTFM